MDHGVTVAAQRQPTVSWGPSRKHLNTPSRMPMMIQKKKETRGLAPIPMGGGILKDGVAMTTSLDGDMMTGPVQDGTVKMMMMHPGVCQHPSYCQI